MGRPPANRALVRAELPRAAGSVRVLRALAVRYLRLLALHGVELSVALVDDAQIRALNLRWRGKDAATDVLSFPAGEAPLPRGQPRPLGDVVISLETARARAREEGRRLDDELARYLAHGLLHLLGHDHHAPGEARRMARAEVQLLGGAGMVLEAIGLDRCPGRP